MKKDTRKRIRNACTTITLIFAIMVLFPLWLRWDKERVYNENGIEVYVGKNANKEQVDQVMARALALLDKHSIRTSSQVSYIFYDTKKEFKVRNLYISSDALATNWVPFGCITFAPNDFATDKQPARKPILNERPISSVIAHELTHTYQSSHLGFVKYKYLTHMAKWKIEGHAEYVSESSSVPLEKGLEMFLSDNAKTTAAREDINAEYFYFKSHLKVDYLLGHKQVTEDEFWETSYDEDQLETEIKQAISEGAYKPKF